MALKFSLSVLNHSRGLLPMFYTPKELANALSASERTIRDVWIKHWGLPYERDSRNHIRVNGETVRQWIADQRQKNAKYGHSMAEGEGYCMKCRRAVVMVNPTVTLSNLKQSLVSGTCPQCHGRVNRGVKKL